MLKHSITFLWNVIISSMEFLVRYNSKACVSCDENLSWHQFIKHFDCYALQRNKWHTHVRMHISLKLAVGVTGVYTFSYRMQTIDVLYSVPTDVLYIVNFIVCWEISSPYNGETLFCSRHFTHSLTRPVTTFHLQ